VKVSNLNLESRELTVSVIIPTRNEENVINDCILSVINQTMKPFEIIIVDGHSTDKTLEIARQHPVQIVIEGHPSSLPNARNLGVENAKGEIVLIIDADVILDKYCIEKALVYFGDTDVVAVIPSEEKVCHTYLEKIQVYWMIGNANPFRTGIGISSFAEFFRKELFAEISFDPNLGLGEDDDFQNRLKIIIKNKQRIVNADKSKIFAHHPHNLQELRSRWVWWGRTTLTYLRKNPSLPAVLNFGSDISPTIFLILAIIFPFLLGEIFWGVIFLLPIFVRDTVACYRSRSIYLLEFVGYDYLRSLFFTYGLLKGLFSAAKGK
jgi:glycosyltransferase involved in cell wall biosynthesis